MSFDEKVPDSLLEVQKWAASMITRPLGKLDSYNLPIYDEETAELACRFVSPGPELSAPQRIGIYNQQYWIRLFNILQNAYPTLVRLFGKTDFNRILACPFLLKYPSRHWALRNLGHLLPRWIQEEYQENDQLLVYQVALVDEAHERMSYIQTFKPFQPAKPEPEKKIKLQPRVELFELDANLFVFRKELLSEEVDVWKEREFPILDWGKHFFVLYLAENRFFYEEISSAQFLFLSRLQKGATLIELCQDLQKQSEEIIYEASQQIGNWVQEVIERGWAYEVL